MTSGGKRKGAGAKLRASTLSKNHSIKFTDSEWEIIVAKSTNEKLSASEYIRKKALE